MAEDRYEYDPYQNNEQAEANQRRAMLLNLLRGRWHWAILLAFLLAVAGGYFGFNSQPDMYGARSFIEIKPDYSSELPVEVVDLSLQMQYMTYVTGEIRSIRSQENIEAAMAQPEWQDNLMARPDDLPEITLNDFASAIEVSDPDDADRRLYVSFDDPDPDTARAGINALLAAYGERKAQEQKTSIGDDLRVLRDRERTLVLQSNALEAEIKQIIPDEDPQAIKERRAFLSALKSRLEIELNDIEIALEPYLEQPEGQTPQQRLDRIRQTPEMQAMLAEKEQLEKNLTTLIEIYNRGENSRDVQQVRRAISVLDRRIAEYETAALAGGDGRPEALPEEITKLNIQRQVVTKRVGELDRQIADLSGKIGAIAELERKKAEVNERIATTQNKITDFVITEDFVAIEGISRIDIGPPADTPTQPWNAGKRRQLAGVGAIGGFFLGFGLVMAVGLFDRRLRHVSDTAAGMPDTNVLGILPTLPADLSDPEEADTAAHCVHHIRTLLQIGGSNRVFSITSPAAGSGKSSLATALGMSFAASGARTLVIDCDLVGAGLSRRMGTVVHEPLEVVIRRNNLLDEASLSSAVTTATAQERALDEVLLEQGLLNHEQLETAIRLQRDTTLGLLDACAPGRLRGCVGVTDIDNFFILPVGKAKPSDASKLSPAAVRELVRQAREAFDIVLIDTGPVLGSLEASIAAAESDATMLIVSRGDQKSLAARTLEQLRSVKANIAGVVFNHALERDLDHTSYASVISQERRADRATRKQRLDQVRSARLGPLGTAVASSSEDNAESNGQANGQHNGQGHD